MSSKNVISRKIVTRSVVLLVIACVLFADAAALFGSSDPREGRVKRWKRFNPDVRPRTFRRMMEPETARAVGLQRKGECPECLPQECPEKKCPTCPEPEPCPVCPSPVTCGTGTHLVGSECVPSLSPVTCGEGTILVDSVCVVTANPISTGGFGDPCTSDANCGTGTYCNTVLGLCGLTAGGMCNPAYGGGIGPHPITNQYAIPTGGTCPSGYLVIGGGGGTECCATWSNCTATQDCCLSDSDCTGGTSCDGPSPGYPGRCVLVGGFGDACASDANCGTGTYCNTVLGLCGLTAGGMCNPAYGGGIGPHPITNQYAVPTGDTCPSGYLVIGGGGGTECCATWSNCTATLDCCLSDGDCTGGKTCDGPSPGYPGRCVSVGSFGDTCASDANCGTGTYCNTILGLCGLTAGGMCNPAYGGGIGPHPITNQFAIPTGGTCPSGYLVIGGGGSTNCCATWSTCTTTLDCCLSDSDCTGGTSCDGPSPGYPGRCVSVAGFGSPCTSDANCASGTYCNTVLGLCGLTAGGMCNPAYGGGIGPHPITNQYAVPTGGTCPPGYLVIGGGGGTECCATWSNCTATLDCCLSDGDCTGGKTCDGPSPGYPGRCVLVGGFGDACTSDANCESGTYCNTVLGLCGLTAGGMCNPAYGGGIGPHPITNQYAVPTGGTCPPGYLVIGGGGGTECCATWSNCTATQDCCLSDGDCTGGTSCDGPSPGYPGRCVLVGGFGDTCASDANCGTGTYCNTVLGLCGLTAGGMCNPAYGGGIGPHPITNQYAVPTGGTCPLGYLVIGGGGGTECCATWSNCTTTQDCCLSDGDCTGGKTCDGPSPGYPGRCVLVGAFGDACASDANCGTGTYCNTVLGLCGLTAGGMCNPAYGGGIGPHPITNQYAVPTGGTCPLGYLVIGGGGGTECCATWSTCTTTLDCCLSDGDCTGGKTCDGPSPGYPGRCVD